MIVNAAARSVSMASSRKMTLVPMHVISKRDKTTGVGRYYSHGNEGSRNDVKAKRAIHTLLKSNRPSYHFATSFARQADHFSTSASRACLLPRDKDLPTDINSAMPVKRKATTSTRQDEAGSDSGNDDPKQSPTKKQQTSKNGSSSSNGNGNGQEPATNDKAEHAHGPEEIYDNENNILKHPTHERAHEIDANLPFDELEDILGGTNKSSSSEPKNVLHWFRSKDLRQEDNVALHAAWEKAQSGSNGATLITAYLHSPEDLEWHGTSPARCAFMLESLRILQKQLHEKHIPLVVLKADKRSDKTSVLSEFIKENDISHVFANYEYEVDEVRRDIKMAEKLTGQVISFELFHDQTVVAPRSMLPSSGKPHKVFTPYHKAWLVHVEENPDLLSLVDAPEANDKSVSEKHKNLFEYDVPPTPDCQAFKSEEDKKRITKLWPPGNGAGLKRMDEFLKNKVSTYAKDRSRPDLDPSSRMSPYFSSGVVSVRQALAKAKEYNGGEENFGNGDPGVASWVREVVFRE